MQSNYAQSCHYVYDDESMYTGTHSVRWYTDNEDGGLITNKFSWDTWGLIPSTAPMLSMPQVYENTIDIPGTNRTVDLSNVLLGFPTFKKRTGSWKFYCDLLTIFIKMQVVRTCLSSVVAVLMACELVVIGICIILPVILIGLSVAHPVLMPFEGLQGETSPCLVIVKYILNS